MAVLLRPVVFDASAPAPKGTIARADIAIERLIAIGRVVVACGIESKRSIPGGRIAAACSVAKHCAATHGGVPFTGGVDL